MPTYQFKNTLTDEIFEEVMRISEYDEYMKNNPHVIRHHDSSSVPPLLDPGSVGLQKPPSDFHIVDGIQKRNPGASKSRKYNTPTEW